MFTYQLYKEMIQHVAAVVVYSLFCNPQVVERTDLKMYQKNREEIEAAKYTKYRNGCMEKYTACKNFQSAPTEAASAPPLLRPSHLFTFVFTEDCWPTTEVQAS